MPRKLLPVVLFCLSAAVSQATDMHYRLQVRIDPAAHSLQAVVDVENLPTTVFYLNRAFQIKNVIAHDQPAPFHQDNGLPDLPYSPATCAYSFDLPQPATLRISYLGSIPDTIAGVNEITPQLVELAVYSGWYPIFKGVKAYTFELTVDLPRGFNSLANGRLVARHTRHQRLVTKWHSYGEVSDIAVVASPSFAQPPYATAKKRVAIYSTGLSNQLVERKATMLGAALDRLSQMLGPPATRGNLSLVYSPRPGWGYSRIPLIVVSEERALNVLRLSDGEARDFRDNAHELAHFWWMIADPSTSDDWLNEGLAEFTAFRLTEQQFGSAFASVRRAEYEQNLARVRPPVAIAETETSSPFREVNRYDRATLMFLDAQKNYGAEAVDRLLRALYRRFANTRNATTSAFLEQAESTMGRDAAAFFRDRLYKAGVL